MKKHYKKGFTLIELLVVITIIAILASIAVPAYNGIQRNAQRSKALSNAKQIALACRVFASEENGTFPNPDPSAAAQNARITAQTISNNSGGAWDLLVEGGYLENEEMFYVPQDPLCTTEPDNDVGPSRSTLVGADDTTNGWSYMNFLTDGSKPFLPLVFSRCDAAAYGDVWDGRVIVVSLDYQGRVERIPAGGTNIPFAGGGNLIDPANTNITYPSTAAILDPAGPGTAP